MQCECERGEVTQTFHLWSREAKRRVDVLACDLCAQDGLAQMEADQYGYCVECKETWFSPWSNGLCYWCGAKG